MPASTFTIAVGSWTEMKPEICSSDDLAAETSFSPSEAAFRFVFGSLKNKHFWEQYDAFIPTTGNVSHPCWETKQNMINQSRKKPYWEGELRGRNVGILFMQKEKEIGVWNAPWSQAKYLYVFC